MTEFRKGDRVQIIDGPGKRYLGNVIAVHDDFVSVDTPPIAAPGGGLWGCYPDQLSLIERAGDPPVAADVAAEALASAVENFTLPSERAANDDAAWEAPVFAAPTGEILPVEPDTTNPKDALGVKKAALRFVPPALAILASDAMADGAAKYGAFNWRETDVRLTVYIEAIERHIAALKDGQDYAEDSGHSHLSHIAANIGIIADADVLGKLIDDRALPGAGPQLLRERDKTGAVVPEWAMEQAKLRDDTPDGSLERWPYMPGCNCDTCIAYCAEHIDGAGPRVGG